MRKIWILLLLVLGLPAYAADPVCTGLCLQQVACPSGGTTSITGTVFAPNGVDPLPNVVVYIPNAPVAAFTSGVACPVPGAPPSGSPLVGTTTAADGTFKLVNVPVGTNLPLVIQSGRWRRQVVVATTTACADTAFSTRMPRNQTEGDIPLIAVATGSVDSVECVLRKVGLDDAEFTNPMSTGRIHLYAGTASRGAVIDTNTPSQNTLMNDPAALAKYDVLMLPCQGGPTGQTTPASLQNLLDYADAGGRVYASHYSYAWFFQNAGLATVANWLGSTGATYADGTATVNTSFASGKTLSDWLQVVGASSSPGQVSVQQPKKDLNGVNSSAQVWLTLNNAAAGNPVMQFTFNTPVGSANQCGRVLFNEYHVEIPQLSINGKFPTECASVPMTNQEKLLEYSLFDLTNTGGQPSLLPTAADFGSQAVGFSAAPKIFTWTNNSIFSASVTSATATSDFTVTSNNCQNVAPNATCQIGVVYRPSALGAATGTLTVLSNSSTSTAALTGTGIPALTVSPTALNFPNTDVGASTSLVYTLQNVASGPVSIGAFAMAGDFAESDTCGISLAAGTACTVRITFTPSAIGSRTGSASINGGPSVALSGTGVDFTIAMTPGSGSVIAGRGLSTPVTLLPISGFSSAVTISCTTTAPGSTCTPNTAGVVPSITAGVSVTITSTSQYTVLGYSGFGSGVAGLLCLGSACLLWRRRHQARSLLLTASAILLLAYICSGVTGCSGKLPDKNPIYTPAGAYTYTVTATDGFLRHSATYSLNVTAK